VNKKIILGLCILVCSVNINAKGGGGSWGGDKTISKYGNKVVVANSRAKTATFNSNDTCQKYIYVDTFLSYRVKDSFWGFKRTFQNGYATTKVTSGNDRNRCSRKEYKVPYLNIDQIVGPRGGKAVAYNDGKNISHIRLTLGKHGTDFSTKHEVKFRDGSKKTVIIGY